MKSITSSSTICTSVRSRIGAQRRLYFLVFLAACLTTMPAAGQATHYFYNSKGDQYNNLCEGYMWQQMGFLDGNGRPAVEGTGKEKDKLLIDGNEVGEVVQRDSHGRASIYRSLRNPNFLYDLNREKVTLTNVFGQVGVGPNDRLFVCGHGGGHTHIVQVRPWVFFPLRHEGGTIQLDRNTRGSVAGFFAGFSNAPPAGGTHVNRAGENWGQPYPFTPPPAGFTGRAKLYTCNGGRDPDANDPGGNGPEIAVSESLKNAGIPTVDAPDQITYARVDITVNPEKAKESLRTQARKRFIVRKNDDGVVAWLASKPFAQQYAIAQGFLPKGATLTLSYREPDPNNPPIVPGCASACADSACNVDFSNLGFGALTIPAGSLPQEPATIVDPGQLDVLELPPGPGAAVGPAVSLLGPDQDPVQLQSYHYASLALPYLAAPGCIPKVYRLDGSSWTPVDSRVADGPDSQVVIASIDQLSIYGVFSDTGCDLTGDAQ